MPPSRPYVSVAFTNRNDNYGGDLNNRIRYFIDYYARYAALWPGLFEFVICDYNPPPGQSSLQESFEWKKLGRVRHVVVPPDVHTATTGPGARKMIECTGRNVAIRLCEGEYTLVLNQDVFISDSIMQFIGARKLDPRYFYRVDRCDFNLDPCRSAPPEAFEKAALANVFCVNRRQVNSQEDLHATLPAGVSIPEALVQAGSFARVEERLDRGNAMAFGEQAMEKYQILRQVMENSEVKSACTDRTYYRQFNLHTNASGDFFLVPRQAFFDICGMVETHVFYTHIDSYAVVQLFAAGYVQALFLQPHRIYHADHSRSDRADFKEPIPFEEHENRFSQVLRGEKSFRFNDENWGMVKFNLPVREDS